MLTLEGPRAAGQLRRAGTANGAMTVTLSEYLSVSGRILQDSIDGVSADDMRLAIDLIVEAIAKRSPVLVCGNGGSASDAMHITAELVGRFQKERRALNCICLSSNPAVLTAWSNDHGFETVFARQVEAYGVEYGVIIGLSTSGNSANVVEAFKTARRLGMKTVGLTGEGGGKLAELSDALLAVPSRSTSFIQQVHICLYHYLCERVEVLAFPDA